MIDLHIHSNYSDGKFSPLELTEQIKNTDIKYCALTDHDSVGGCSELIDALSDSDITCITGVELSVLYQDIEIHILAYDLDLKKVTEILEQRSKIVLQQKKKALGRAIELFRKQGFEVSDGLKLAPKKTVGYIVAWDVYSNKKNQQLLIERHGHLLDEEEFFNFYQKKGAPCYVPRCGVSVDWAVPRFRKLAQNLILAHPFVPVSFCVKPLKEEQIYDLLKKGIDGIEIYHDRTSEEKINKLKQIVEKNRLYFSGGSDSHGRPNDTSLGYYNEKQEVPGFFLKNFKYP